MLKLTALFGGFVLIPMVIVALTVFWIWMLVDCANHETDHDRRIAWLVIISLTHWLGATLYFILGRRRRAIAS